MRQQGTVVHWDAERGFGFIDNGKAGSDVFFHLDDFRGGPTPKAGLTVSFRQVDGGERGPRAVSVMPTASVKTADFGASLDLEPLDRTSEWAHSSISEIAQLDRTRPRRPPPAYGPDWTGWLVFVLFLGVWLVVVTAGSQQGRLPLLALAALSLINVATLVLYAVDKAAARGGGWRVSEQRIHIAALLGGWPLGWFAQKLLSHKTRKSAFRQMYWITAFLHTAALAAWVFWPVVVRAGSVAQ